MRCESFQGNPKKRGGGGGGKEREREREMR